MPITPFIIRLFTLAAVTDGSTATNLKITLCLPTICCLSPPGTIGVIIGNIILDNDSIYFATSDGYGFALNAEDLI